MDQSVLATEFVMALVAVKKNGVYVDPTGDTAEMSFPAVGSPPVNWFAGSWETDHSTGTPRYYAQCLVGPGGAVELAVGKYEVFLKVSDNPETPVRKLGVLSIY